jgi:hypothetical protein
VVGQLVPVIRGSARWPTWSQLWRHSAYETLLTAVLLFGVASVVRWAIGALPISGAVHGIHLELLVVGLVVGLLPAGPILSPLGKPPAGTLPRNNPNG